METPQREAFSRASSDFEQFFQPRFDVLMD